MSLQWGRQQTYYPSAQPLTTKELAAANHKLAVAINSHLLGNSSTTTANLATSTSISSNTVKSSSVAAEQLCSTPAEKMAIKVKPPDLSTFFHENQEFTHLNSLLPF